MTRKPVGHAHDRVVVAHPARLVLREVVEQHGAAVELHRGLAELRRARAADLAAERPGQRLHAVADAQHRHPELEDAGVEVGRARLVDARRPAGEDDPDRVARAQLLDRRVVRQELREHAALAHAPGDQLRVLRAEVEHDDRPLRLLAGLHARPGVVGPRLGDHRLIPTLCSRCSFLPSVCRAGANMISAFWNSWIVS